jgi:hypothetical protein
MLKGVKNALFVLFSFVDVDEGKFVGSDRLTSQDIPVYDLSLDAEIIKKDSVITSIDFRIYLNNTLIGKVTDNNPLQASSSGLKTCLFTRGSSKCMFENIYALKNAEEKDVSVSDRVKNTISTESLRKYSLPGVIQNTFFSSVSAEICLRPSSPKRIRASGSK